MKNENIFLRHLLNSYSKFTNEILAKDVNELLILSQPVLSHQTEEDPLINFANNKALELWETTENQFIGLPSKKTAEPMLHYIRKQFLREVEEYGFTSGYEGVRISQKGNRFRIKDAIVWNVLNENDEIIGQAATFKNWSPVN